MTCWAGLSRALNVVRFVFLLAKMMQQMIQMIIPTNPKKNTNINGTTIAGTIKKSS